MGMLLLSSKSGIKRKQKQKKSKIVIRNEKIGYFRCAMVLSPQPSTVFLFDAHNVMIHSRSVFYPIPSQFQDQQIFVKRDTLYKRQPKTLSNHFSSIQEKSKTLPIHGNYNNLKKKLQDYIHKEKHKLQLSFLGNTETNFSKEKSKLIFRKNKGISNKKSQHCIFTIPSEDIKLSFTENLLNSKARYDSLNISASGSELVLKEGVKKVKIKKMPHFNLRYESADQSMIGQDSSLEPRKVEQKINATSLQLPQEKPFLIKRKKGRSKVKNELTKNCQILGKKCKPEVLIYPSFSSLEVQDLERKKHELIKINKTLKFRKTAKLCLNKRASQKSNDVGPWSKANHLQEDEIALDQSESFCKQ